jgi:hypothetical protein
MVIVRITATVTVRINVTVIVAVTITVTITVSLTVIVMGCYRPRDHTHCDHHWYVLLPLSYLAVTS